MSAMVCAHLQRLLFQYAAAVCLNVELATLDRLDFELPLDFSSKGLAGQVLTISRLNRSQDLRGEDLRRLRVFHMLRI